jgi:hypothetical protein
MYPQTNTYVFSLLCWSSDARRKCSPICLGTYMFGQTSSQCIYLFGVTVYFKSYALGHASCPQVSNVCARPADLASWSLQVSTVCASAMHGPEQDHQLSSIQLMSRKQSMLSPSTTTTSKAQGMPIANIGFYWWCTSEPRN